jgi:hypothetical protein
MKSSPIKLKQKLSPKASAAKKVRDLAAANSPYRKKLRADSQKKRRKESPAFLKGKDYDHKDNKFKSVKDNRGNDGEGTKKE